ncbi:hypothetical protein EV421DRAFT_1738939 [Armillaria borealis]|uniref:Uncharacterized protein n=1 Tax=Armillaria borealis TaxID=47425 RepID=A0AA39J7H1_9AGAR|nr:hypothetical protein EV421DRAFT_1738939 [Armillaria borealis]
MTEMLRANWKNSMDSSASIIDGDDDDDDDDGYFWHRNSCGHNSLLAFRKARKGRSFTGHGNDGSPSLAHTAKRAVEHNTDFTWHQPVTQKQGPNGQDGGLSAQDGAGLTDGHHLPLWIFSLVCFFCHDKDGDELAAYDGVLKFDIEAESDSTLGTAKRRHLTLDEEFSTGRLHRPAVPTTPLTYTLVSLSIWDDASMAGSTEPDNQHGLANPKTGFRSDIMDVGVTYAFQWDMQVFGQGLTDTLWRELMGPVAVRKSSIQFSSESSFRLWPTGLGELYTENSVGVLKPEVNPEYSSQEERGQDYNDDLEWHFSEGEPVLVPNSTMGIVTCMQSTAVEINTADGPLWYRWYDIIKYYQLGDYVEVVGGEMQGRHGFVQGVDDENFINIMEGHYSQGVREMTVHRNLSRIISPPTRSSSFGLSPEEMAKRMHTGRVPWQGLCVLVLPSTGQSKKQCFDQLEKLSSLSHEADVHKGKIRTVLDVGINQVMASGLRICVHLEQNYSAVHTYRDIWVDYDKVVEETYVHSF